MKTLVLDLDETLIHTSPLKVAFADFSFRVIVFFDFELKNNLVWRREALRAKTTWVGFVFICNVSAV